MSHLKAPLPVHRPTSPQGRGRSGARSSEAGHEEFQTKCLLPSWPTARACWSPYAHVHATHTDTCGDNTPPRGRVYRQEKEICKRTLLLSLARRITSVSKARGRHGAASAPRCCFVLGLEKWVASAARRLRFWPGHRCAWPTAAASCPVAVSEISREERFPSAVQQSTGARAADVGPLLIKDTTRPCPSVSGLEGTPGQAGWASVCSRPQGRNAALGSSGDLDARRGTAWRTRGDGYLRHRSLS